LYLSIQDDDFLIGINSGQVDDYEAVPTNLDIIARVLQWMTNQDDPINEDEIKQAAEILEEVIHKPNPAQEVSDRIDKIDSILTALLELNIRQAHADGRSELALALKNLLDNIFIQIGLPINQKIQQR